MLREIKGNLYCIKSYTGVRRYVECDNVEELAEHVADMEVNKGYIITSVTSICIDGSTPRVAVRSMKPYKSKYKKLMEERKNV